MAEPCPRCGYELHPGDELCRRCGTELARPRPLDLPQAPGLTLDRARFSLPWLVAGTLGYMALLFGAFQLFHDTFRDYAPVLEKVRMNPGEARAYADALSDFALRLLVLVVVCYLVGGLALGRFAGGRVLLQAAVGAALSWAVMFFQIGVSGPVFLPMLMGGGIVTGTAAVGAWVGRALRPKPARS